MHTPQQWYLGWGDYKSIFNTNQYLVASYPNPTHTSFYVNHVLLKVSMLTVNTNVNHTQKRAEQSFGIPA